MYLYVWEGGVIAHASLLNEIKDVQGQRKSQFRFFKECRGDGGEGASFNQGTPKNECNLKSLINIRLV